MNWNELHKAASLIKKKISYGTIGQKCKSLRDKKIGILNCFVRSEDWAHGDKE